MKKIIGVILVVVALMFAFFEFGAGAIAEEIAMQEINRKFEEISVSETITAEPEETIEVIPEEITEEIPEEIIEETIPEVHSFDWISNCEFGEDLGRISIYHEDNEILSTPLGFGGSTDNSINRKAGLHEQLSNVDELFVLGHYYQDKTCFARLNKAVEGDIVKIETYNYGTFEFKVTASRYVTEAEYAENNYDVCTSGEDTLTLATCEWQNNVKGRRIVICEYIPAAN